MSEMFKNDKERCKWLLENMRRTDDSPETVLNKYKNFLNLVEKNEDEEIE